MPPEWLCNGRHARVVDETQSHAGQGQQHGDDVRPQGTDGHGVLRVKIKKRPWHCCQGLTHRSGLRPLRRCGRNYPQNAMGTAGHANRFAPAPLWRASACADAGALHGLNAPNRRRHQAGGAMLLMPSGLQEPSYSPCGAIPYGPPGGLSSRRALASAGGCGYYGLKLSAGWPALWREPPAAF